MVIQTKPTTGAAEALNQTNRKRNCLPLQGAFDENLFGTALVDDLVEVLKAKKVCDTWQKIKTQSF